MDLDRSSDGLRREPLRADVRDVETWQAAPALAVARALDAERAHVRAWLHDGVLQMLEYLAAGGYDDAIDVARMQRVAALAADELRAFVDDDEPPPRSDLVTALIDVVSRAQLLGAGLEIEVLAGRVEGEVGRELTSALAAAAGEALVNVRKHARATHARVTCETLDGHLAVCVEDDGIGFDVEAAAGRGLTRSVVGRMLAAGGTARVQSRPGEGTRITLRAPLVRPGFVVEVAS